MVRSSWEMTTRPRSRDADRLAVLLGDDAVFQVQRDRRPACWRAPGTAAVPRSIRPTAFRRCSLPSRSATSAIDKPGGHQPLGLDFDDDLADVAALDRDVGHVGDAADARPQIVVGVVVQRRRVAPAGDHERNDRKDRGRLPLDDRAGARREAATRRRPSARARRSGPGPFGAGHEIDVDLGGPADRFRPHALHAQHDVRPPLRWAA